MALFEGLTDWQKQCPRSTVYKFIISSYLKDASGHFRGPTPQELSQAAQNVRSEVVRACAPRPALRFASAILHAAACAPQEHVAGYG